MERSLFVRSRLFTALDLFISLQAPKEVFWRSENGQKVGPLQELMQLDNHEKRNCWIFVEYKNLLQKELQMNF